ncbi:MAG: ATP-grasp domain-containing protein [Methanomassiliicoccales archaeon]|nr:ATP-grasp domain-containing protein [Methanomassiliicoccales archaeon]
MSNSIKILITDANYKHTLGAVRSLSKAGFIVDAIGKKISLAGMSRYLNSIAYDDRLFDENHIDEFLDFLANKSYEVLLPIGARSVRLVAKFKKEIEKYCRTPVSEIEKVDYCLDKKKTCDLAKSLGISVPESFEVDFSKEKIDLPSKMRYPVFVKGSHEIHKRRPSIAKNEKELIEILRKWQNDAFSRDHSPLIQEFIQGHGFGYFALYKKGRCIQSFMHERIRESPAIGGPSTCAVSIFDEELMSLGQKLLDALEWHGVAMVEFRRDGRTKEYYLMEINPKFWGSLDLAIACGVDFPTMAVNMALDKEIVPIEKYEVGVKFHWPFDGEIAHAIENPSAIPSIMKDLLNPDVRSNLWRSDPLPSFLSFFEEIYRVARTMQERLQ